MADTGDTATLQGVAVVNHGVSRIKDLPPAILNKLNEKLLNRTPCRKAQQWLDEQGYKFSHTAVNDYTNRVIVPAMRIGAQLHAMQPVADKRDPAIVEQADQVKGLTRQALAAAPLIARSMEVWAEAKHDLEASRGSSDWKGRSALMQAARGIIETEAKLSSVGAFGHDQAPTNTTNIVVMLPAQALPAAPQLPDGDVIDAEVIE